MRDALFDKHLLAIVLVVSVGIFQYATLQLNTWNKVTFAAPNQSWAAGSTTFGTITGTASNYNPRDYQFAAHIKF